MARASAGRWVARLLVALVVLFVLVQAWFAAHILWYRWQAPVETAFMAQRLAELRQKDPKATIKFQWVPYARISTHLKRAVIAAAGGHGLRRLLDEAGLRRNSALAGAYGFEAQGYGERMRDRLAELPARGGWLFCHPGDADPELHDDPIAAARIQEAVYLASPAFADDLRAAGVELITPA